MLLYLTDLTDKQLTANGIPFSLTRDAPAPRQYSSPNAIEGGYFPSAEGPEFDANAAARYRERGVGASEDVLCVDWSPFCTDFFAAAVADGTVAVYGVGASRPRLVLAAPSNLPLLAVRWSCDRPSILFALDAGSTVFAWDLTQAASDPTYARCARRARLPRAGSTRKERVGTDHDSSCTASPWPNP